jgi:hypothetical protein
MFGSQLNIKGIICQETFGLCNKCVEYYLTFCAKLLLDDIMLLLNTGHPFAKLPNMKGPAFSRNILSFCLIWIDADLHHIIVGGLRVLSGV